MRVPIIAASTAGVLLVALPAFAQPQVPPGFTVRRIAPLLDDALPQLSAIDDPGGFGIGVATAVADEGVLTLRLIEPSGTIQALGAIAEPSDQIRAMRVRLDTDGAVDGRLHCSLRVRGGTGEGETAYFTLEPGGPLVEAWRRTDLVVYDFEFVRGQPGLGDGAVLLDTDGDGGTELSFMRPDFSMQLLDSSSLPAGRIDLDVQGVRRDATGRYGGGVLLADTEDNDLVSAIYELRDLAGGGDYRAIFGPVPWNEKRYGDLDMAAAGVFGGIIYVTETLTDEIQTVDELGTHTTWATEFTNIDALSISDDGASMYVADQNGVWLIRESGMEPGPVVLAADPSTPAGSPICGPAITSLRVIFSEPVRFVDSDVAITDGDGNPVGFDASGSGSQFLLIGLGTPLDGDTYTVTIRDSVVAVATGRSIDGDRDGSAGGDALIRYSHACRADFDGDGALTIFDFLAFQNAFDAGCP
ncbi:MAG: hypothetical protein NCW75_15490 [Phycisphaera sp.]|nr:MAG: hypothetical protein NCW75_15490 [Phycisphaera sp.]